MEQTEEFLEIVGVVHKNYPELDDPNYYGTYLKPSEFDEAIKYMEGLPVTVGHTRDKDGNVVQSVGKVIKAFRGDKGEIQAKIYIPIDSEVSSRVKYDILDNPLNPKRNLSFSAEVIKAEGPGVPGISDKTEFNYGFDFSEIAIVDVPGVPQSKIKSAVLGHKNLNTGEITYKRKEIYNSFNKQPIIVEKMDSQASPHQQQASQAPPQAQVTRTMPQNMDQVRVGPPAGGELQKDLQEQDKQLGLQTHTQQLTPAQQHLANQIATMQAEAQKWASEVAKAQEMLTAAQKQKEELDAYNNKLAEEKRIREEEETKKQNAKLLEREKEKWAAAEISVYASKDATAIAEFEKARNEHFNNVALGKIDPVLKWSMFAQDCSATAAITGVQAQQKRQMDVNNENQRILMENHKRVKEELDKKKAEVQEVENQLKMAAAYIPDPNKAFDILEWQKKREQQSVQQAQQQQQPPQQQPPQQGFQQGVQPYQPPNQYGYQHQLPPGPFPYESQQHQPNPVPNVIHNPSLSLQDNLAANLNQGFFQSESFQTDPGFYNSIEFSRAVAVASRTVEAHPQFKEHKAVVEFAGLNPEAFERILNREGGTVVPLQYE